MEERKLCRIGRRPEKMKRRREENGRENKGIYEFAYKQKEESEGKVTRVEMDRKKKGRWSVKGEDRKR